MEKEIKDEVKQETEDVQINNMNQLVDVLTEEINLMRSGRITPSRAHAMANLTGKIMQAVKLSVECHKYVQRLDSKASPVPLMDFALRETSVLKNYENMTVTPDKNNAK